jgi:hypothetical protein
LLDELLCSPEDASLYQRNLGAFDAMRGLTTSLPRVRVCWVEVLISRFELFDAVGRNNGASDAEGQLARLRQKHLETLNCFRRLCCHYITDSLAARPPAELPRSEATPKTLLQVAQRHVEEGDQRVKQQQKLVERLEARGADASAAHKMLGTMQDALDTMYRDLEVARRRSS